MDFIILWTLSTIGAFTCIVTALVVAYIFYELWCEGRQTTRQAQAELEQRISYTQGAAYDACLDEPTDHNEVARRLLNW